jgi:hypothetical protein
MAFGSRFMSLAFPSRVPSEHFAADLLYPTLSPTQKYSGKKCQMTIAFIHGGIRLLSSSSIRLQLKLPQS